MASLCRTFTQTLPSLKGEIEKPDFSEVESFNFISRIITDPNESVRLILDPRFSLRARAHKLSTELSLWPQQGDKEDATMHDFRAIITELRSHQITPPQKVMSLFS